MSTSVKSVVWLCCDIIDTVKALTHPGLRPPKAKSLEIYSKNNKLFKSVLFLVGIFFIISATGHHHLSLIPCLRSPAILTQLFKCVNSERDLFFCG